MSLRFRALPAGPRGRRHDSKGLQTIAELPEHGDTLCVNSTAMMHLHFQAPCPPGAAQPTARKGAAALAAAPQASRRPDGGTMFCSTSPPSCGPLHCQPFPRPKPSRKARTTSARTELIPGGGDAGRRLRRMRDSRPGADPATSAVGVSSRSSTSAEQRSLIGSRLTAAPRASSAAYQRQTQQSSHHALLGVCPQTVRTPP